MGRRRWQHYQQLLMENVHLKDEDSPMEKKIWESSDKCNFCDESSNTSQQTVDNIVPESQEQSKTKSHSSESSYETEDSEEDVVDAQNHLNFPRSPYNASDNIPHSFYYTKNKLNSMSSLESVASSVAASMAAVAAMNNISLQKSFGNLRFSPNITGDVVPQWYLPPPNFKLESTTGSKKDESDTDMPDEQPLDLSAKSCSPVNSPTESPTEAPSPVFVPSQNFSSGNASSLSPQSLKVPVYNSNRHIFKAKPRLSPMTGRRTYTEEELQLALRDIQSGKLGTRRAAVIYGIPRSTLRNKVYKLAMEKERDSTALLPNLTTEDRRIETETDVPSDDKEELEDRDNENEDEDDDVDKELSATEEDKDVEKSFVKPTFTVEDLIRFSKQNPTPLVDNESLRVFFQGNKFLNEPAFKQEKDTSSSSQLPPPLYSIFPPGAAEIWGNLDAASIAPYLSNLMMAARDNFNISSLVGHTNPYYLNVRNQNSSGDSPTEVSAPSFSPKFPAPLLPELVQRMLVESEEQRKRELQNKTSESGSFSSPSADAMDEANNSSHILNRLPFFKPSYKNGSTSESAFCGLPDYNAENRVSEGSEKSTTSSPPPPSTARSESSSPLPVNHKVGLNLREVIAKTIGQRFQTPDLSISHMAGGSNLEGLHRVSFPPMPANSVIKSQSGAQADDRKLCNQAKVPLTSSVTSVAAAAVAVGASSGGKGTRPKRGKYRNYDRDSLIEAVRAVQRGEMSVHRAGSHFGVPHSTLEYKVKERHLMRPRKREPKNQPDELKRREDGSVLRLSSVNEKPAQHSPSSQPKISKSPFTPPTSLPTTPNGLKIPALFEAAHPFATGPPFPFWPAPFHQLAMDYSRNSAAFSSNPEHILASHFVQRMQEESAKTNAALPSGLTALGKNAREMAESLYDGSGINGNFLDGVIRSSLDNDQAFSENLQKKNLLEQLCRNKYLNPNSRGDESDGEEGNKTHINQILAQTLLSSVAARGKGCSSKNEDSGDDKEELSTATSSTATTSEEEKTKGADEMGRTNVQNPSLNVESQIVKPEIKMEKN